MYRFGCHTTWKILHPTVIVIIIPFHYFTRARLIVFLHWCKVSGGSVSLYWSVALINWWGWSGISVSDSENQLISHESPTCNLMAQATFGDQSHINHSCVVWYLNVTVDCTKLKASPPSGYLANGKHLKGSLHKATLHLNWTRVPRTGNVILSITKRLLFY